MSSTSIAVISDSVSLHYAKNNQLYPVQPTKIIGSAGSPSSGSSGGTSSGSVDVFADGLNVHRKYDITGQQHLSFAIYPQDQFAGLVPVETILTLEYLDVFNGHPLGSYLNEGSPSVFANGLPVGFHGATYVCSAIVDARPTATVMVATTI